MYHDIIAMFKDNDMTTTENIEEAIFILPNGQLISGEFDCGIRGLDHHVIEGLFDDLDRGNDTFWNDIVERTNIIQYVPETEIALIKEGQHITKEQQAMINQHQLQTEIY
ncbi:hypothetical protein VWJ19_00090 [Staphylococcus hominis]|uniref:hypothetical protein n=1 Tax=Staphylococcus hominis TaxID=1290 RepID=UPI002E17203D|nr:hypothetical protein [Staphylococcus hominis]MEC5415279.1 hypothetical protein [Staphylococcus hominis]